MRGLEETIKEAQRMIRLGNFAIASDLIDQAISKAKVLDDQNSKLKAENKQHKLTIRQMDRRIMAGDR